MEDTYASSDQLIVGIFHYLFASQEDISTLLVAQESCELRGISAEMQISCAVFHVESQSRCGTSTCAQADGQSDRSQTGVDPLAKFCEGDEGNKRSLP